MKEGRKESVGEKVRTERPKENQIKETLKGGE